MRQETLQDPFTAFHHALLFTCIAEPLIESAGRATGEKILRQAVRRYGQQRGHRMALRAEKNGHPLNLENYFAYGGWAVPKGQMQYNMTEKRPHARLIVTRCPWYQTWESHGLLNTGKYFCKEIDAALLNGFNPELTIEVESTRTNGGTHCDFVFKAVCVLYNRNFLNNVTIY